MPSLLLFDLDGTLVDTLGFIIECFRRSVQSLIKRPPADEEIVATFGPAEPECIARLLSRYDREGLLLQPLTAEQIAGSVKRFYELYHDGYADGMVQLYPGMKEVVQVARSAGWALGIFTGKGRNTAVDTLNHLGMTSLFDVVVTSDDIDRPKPAPDGVRLAARRTATSTDKTCFVGDNPADIIAGKAAGAITIAALWGAFDPEATRRAHPDYVLDSPLQLQSQLTKLTAAMKSTNA